MNNEPKKLDWIVAAGFVVFIATLIFAIFSENLRWLGVAFLIMTVVIGFGLVNNIKNMQPDWSEDAEDVDIFVPDAPASLKKASGTSSTDPNRKWAYWKTIIMLGVCTVLFFALGLFIIFIDSPFQ